MITMRHFLTATAITATLAFMPDASAWSWNWSWGPTVTGSGTAKTEDRSVSGFSGVSVSLPAKVTIVQGDKESVTIEGDDNIVALIETNVDNGILKLRFADRHTNVKTKTRLAITVYAKTIEQLSVAGSGDIIADAIKTTRLKASIAGAGDVAIKHLTADTLKISISGSGEFAAAGAAGSIEASIAGSGDIKVGKLESKTVKISIAGSGDALVWAKDALSVSVAGSGDVKYYGNPEVKTSVAGSGSTRRLGEAPGAK